MKILSITAGAAGMYCGSCFRDNALARELMARGHDVTLVPRLHADAHRRTQRQPAACAVRRHQRLPPAALLDLPNDAALSRPALGFAEDHQHVRRTRGFDRSANCWAI